MSSIKKVLSVILILALALVAFGGLGGCGSGKPLRVYVEGLCSPYNNEVLAEELSAKLKELKGPAVEFEFLPNDPQEAETTRTRLREEIAAGEGPDVFLIGSASTDGQEQDRLFPLPEKAMEQGVFLALDPYIEKAEFLRPEKVTAGAMAAGINRTGEQVLFPLSDRMPVAIFLKEETDYVPSKDFTWNDMVNDESQIMQAAAALDKVMATIPNGFYFDYPVGEVSLCETFGALADYNTGELLFSEEELLERIDQLLTLEEKHIGEGFEKIPDFFSGNIGYNLVENNDARYMDELIFEKDGAPTLDLRLADDYPVTLVPIYCDDGGIAVTVETYGAVNANTKRPDDAFFLLDMLTDTEVLEELGVFATIFQDSAPVNTEMLMLEHPAPGSPNALVTPICLEDNTLVIPYYLPNNAFAAFDSLREQITCATVSGVLNDLLDAVFYQCYDVHFGRAEGEESALVHEAYQEMIRAVEG